MAETTGSDWLRRAVKAYFEEVYDDEANAAKMTAADVTATAERHAVMMNAVVSALDETLKKIGEYVTSGSAEAGRLAAYTINNISGTHIDPNAIFGDLSGTITRSKMVDIGTQFRQVVDQMFPIDTSTVNTKDRADRQFAVDNVGAYFGTNLNYQLRSLSIGILGSLIPFIDASEFKNLHESLLWAYGLPWMSWSVLSSIMNVTTTKPLTEYYNAKIKGNDFTEAQALHAFTQKRLQQAELTKILDNHGIRDDIRQTLIDQTYRELSEEQATRLFIEGHITQSEFTRVMDAHGTRDQDRQARIDGARPKLSDGKLAQGYENGLFTEQFVKDELKSHGYDEVRGQAELDLIKDNRLFSLRKRLEETFFHGYVIGTVTQAEFTNYLASIGYSQLEVDMELKRAEIIARSHLQKHLTRAEIIRLVADGGMAASEGLARLVAQGLPDTDARRLLADSVLRYAVSLVPAKVRDACLTGHVEQNLLTAAIQTVTQLDPTYVVTNKAFFNQAQCILDQYTSGAASTAAPAPAQAPPAPTALTGGVGPTGIDLHWQPIQGLADYQLYRRQIGDAAYLPIGPSSTKMTFTDTTITKGEIYLYVVRAKVNGVESPNSNEVQVQP